MSLTARTTHDYSPLRGPIVSPITNRDLRPHKERQQYEQAVNARREMLNVLGSAPPKKLSKKAYERLRAIKSPVNLDPELTPIQRRKNHAQANAGARRALKMMLKGEVLNVESEDGAA